jgi:glycosyltransferase involved in cell wall biosynthesis
MEWVFLRNTPVIFAEASYADEYPWIRKSAIVQNFPKIGEFSQRTSGRDESLTMVYVGAVAEIRGSEMMLEVISRLQREKYAIGLTCIGPATKSHLAELNEQIEVRGLRDVEFLGYQPPQVAWRLASKADIGLAILQPHPNYFRSYPTKMFEYMSMGLPVVVSDFPLYREVIEESRCGICVQPDDVEEILRELRPLLNSENLRIEMGANGRRAVERRYSWEVEEEKLLSFYSSL